MIRLTKKDEIRLIKIIKETASCSQEEDGARAILAYNIDLVEKYGTRSSSVLNKSLQKLQLIKLQDIMVENGETIMDENNNFICFDNAMRVIKKVLDVVNKDTYDEIVALLTKTKEELH